jgi:hypothetical protein
MLHGSEVEALLFLRPDLVLGSLNRNPRIRTDRLFSLSLKPIEADRGSSCLLTIKVSYIYPVTVVLLVLPETCTGWAFEWTDDARGYPAAIKIPILRGDPFFSDEAYIDTRRIERQMIL